jgi:hypothetical protein
MSSSTLTTRALRGVWALGFASATWLVAAASIGQPVTSHDRPRRGKLVSATPLATLEAAALVEYLDDFELDTSHVKSGVDAYRLIYGTIGPDGSPTTASSLVVVPHRHDDAFRTAVWMHGTTVYRGDAASVSDESEDRAAAYFLAAGGYLVTAPDYLGLGKGPGRHPYDHAATEVSASIDALRATTAWARRQGLPLDRDVSITGLSQGGRASLELAKALQRDPDWSVAALAPISGPYDMSETLAVAAAGNIDHVTPYLAYLTVAWNRVYHLYDSPSDAFMAPYNRTAETLFDSYHTTEEVFAGLPATLDELFTPDFLAELRQPTGALLDALHEADGACDWQPEIKVHLYAASGDRDVPIDNAHRCQQQLAAHASEVEVIDLGDVDHSTSGTLALPRVLADFDAASH